MVHSITGHNGFTLRDLVSYDVKHNEANGEKNLDGTEYNYSWNCGAEGPSRKKKSVKSAPVRNEMHFLCLCLVWHHREFFREMNLEIHKKEIIMHIVRIMRLHGLTGVC